MRDAFRKEGTEAETLAVTRATLRRAMRKVLVEFQLYGVTTADFLDARDNPKELRNLLRKTKGHPYAELLIGVLDSSRFQANGADVAHSQRNSLNVFCQAAVLRTATTPADAMPPPTFSATSSTRARSQR